jgi:hypothetical protein
LLCASVWIADDKTPPAPEVRRQLLVGIVVDSWDQRQAREATELDDLGNITMCKGEVGSTRRLATGERCHHKRLTTTVIKVIEIHGLLPCSKRERTGSLSRAMAYS